MYFSPLGWFHSKFEIKLFGWWPQCNCEVEKRVKNLIMYLKTSVTFRWKWHAKMKENLLSNRVIFILYFFWCGVYCLVPFQFKEFCQLYHLLCWYHVALEDYRLLMKSNLINDKLKTCLVILLNFVSGRYFIIGRGHSKT